MKKLLFVASVAAMLPVAGFSENGLKYSYAKDMYGDLNVGYGADTNSEKAKNNIKDKYYVGARGELSLLSWDNEYKEAVPTMRGSDSYSFEPVLGLDLFVGYKFSDLIRTDVEIGYIGEFKETETEYYVNYMPEKTTFALEAYYLTANIYLNLKHGLYVGAGLGGALTNLSLDHTWYEKSTEKHFSLMTAGMFGWSYALDETTEFDLRYRLSAFDGGDIFYNGVRTDVGYIMDNSFSAGVRCYF